MEWPNGRWQLARGSCVRSILEWRPSKKTRRRDVGGRVSVLAHAGEVELMSPKKGMILPYKGYPRGVEMRRADCRHGRILGQGQLHSE